MREKGDFPIDFLHQAPNWLRRCLEGRTSSTSSSSLSSSTSTDPILSRKEARRRKGNKSNSSEYFSTIEQEEDFVEEVTDFVSLTDYLNSKCGCSSGDNDQETSPDQNSNLERCRKGKKDTKSRDSSEDNSVAWLLDMENQSLWREIHSRDLKILRLQTRIRNSDAENLEEDLRCSSESSSLDHLLARKLRAQAKRAGKKLRLAEIENARLSEALAELVSSLVEGSKVKEQDELLEKEMSLVRRQTALLEEKNRILDEDGRARKKDLKSLELRLSDMEKEIESRRWGWSRADCATGSLTSLSQSGDREINCKKGQRLMKQSKSLSRNIWLND